MDSAKYNAANRLFLFLIRALLLGWAGLLVYLNLHLYYQPDFSTSPKGTYNESVYRQLQHLGDEIHAGAAEDMQDLFPEGFLFLNALYALAWVDCASPLTKSQEQKVLTEALREIDWSLAQINSPTGKQIFDENLYPTYGAFYLGWSNYVLARRLALVPADARPKNQVAVFQQNCAELAAAFDSIPGPWLETYPHSAWPADNVVAIASLAEHDRLFNTRVYQGTIQRWLAEVKTVLDPETGLIPHSVFFANNAISEGARGSSQSLIQCFLPVIDSAFAAQQYTLYQQHFQTHRLGLPGIREYPYGKVGTGDIDSGPVIWEVGGAASIVGQRAAALQGDDELFVGLRNCIELFGVGVSWRGKKRYLFGYLPIADAFIAWSNSAEKAPNQITGGGWWRSWVQFTSILIFLLLLWLWRKL